MIIVGNGRLITRNPDAPFYESGAVAIEGNSIVKVGDLKTIQAEFPNAEFIDAKAE